VRDTPVVDRVLSVPLPCLRTCKLVWLTFNDWCRPDAASGVWNVVLPVEGGEECCAQKNVRVTAVEVQKQRGRKEYCRSLSMVDPEAAKEIRHKTNPERIHSLEDWLCLTRVQNTLILPPFRDLSPPISSYLYLRLLDVNRLERLQACGAINSLPSSERIQFNHHTQILSIHKHVPGTLPSGGGWFSRDPPVKHCDRCGQGTSKLDREICKGCGVVPSWVAAHSMEAEELKRRLAHVLSKEPALFTALLPVNVLGDGNCCPHSCSVALWGVHDRVYGLGAGKLGTLRSSLSHVMNQHKSLFFERWKRQEMLWDSQDAIAMGMEHGFQRSQEEWSAEFQDLLARSGTDGAYLCQIHIYVLAHLLRRPIIVYADTVQQDSPCRMRGLYLPMEHEVTGIDWETAPLLLAFDGAHFVPLTYHLKHWPPTKPEPRERWIRKTNKKPYT
jgi:hypothetical protein